MEGRIIFPALDTQCELVPPAHRANFIKEIKDELLWCIDYAQRAKEPLIKFNLIRETPRQLILEFEVLDLQKPQGGQHNWHGQNTSQWVYAGAVVYDRESGRISRHH